MSNAFTSAFKRLDPVPQFKATAKLDEFLAQLPSKGQSFSQLKFLSRLIHRCSLSPYTSI